MSEGAMRDYRLRDQPQHATWHFAGRAVLTCALLLPAISWAQQSVPGADLVVARPVINMYKDASADSEVTSQVLYGTGVLSLEKKEGWAKIRTADDYTGWIQLAEVAPQASPAYAADARAVRVTAISANVYREPDATQHAPLLRLPCE